MNSADPEVSYKLSPMQQGMLFHHQLEPGSGIDIEQMVCTLPEALDVAAFKKAWGVVVSRHQALRTSFQWEGVEEPLQHVHFRVDIPFEFQDLQNLSADMQQNELEEYIKLDRKRGFDLTDAPLMRLALFRMGKADYRVVWTFHHIIADGRSHPIILNEAFALYEAICEKKDLKLKQPRRYQDYIAWLGQRDHSKSETYWRQLLHGFTAPTPVDAIPKLSGQDDHEEDNGEQEIELTESITSFLNTVAKKHHLTLSTLIQGSWALLLSRYSGGQDVVFGTVRACRRDTVGDAESVVGLFINTLPVRVRVSFDQNLGLWLKELREQNMAIRNFEHTPLLQVLGWSDVRHGKPLFESIIVFDKYYLNSRLRDRGGKWRRREFRLIEKTGFPLALYAYADHVLSLKISYDKRRFDDAAIGQMLGNLKTLLEGMAENIDRPLSTLPMLTEREKSRLLREWNETRTDYPREKCIHHLFEEQVERTPDFVSLVFEDSQLTYRELNGRANRLARHLLKLGVGPETRVGIYMERSLEMMVGVLGVLKAGGAYLPLDHTYPAERIAFMLEDAQVPVLLIQSRLVRNLPAHQAQVLCVDADWDVISTEAEENVHSGVTPRNMSYLIYTSGSTGKAKGVMVCHCNVVNFFAGMDERIPSQPADVWLAVTSISFDIHVLELLWTLARGFKIVLHADRTRSLEPAGHQENTKEKPEETAGLINGGEQYTIPAQIRRHGVTHFQCTPSLASMLLSDDETRVSLRSVKTFMVGGEALPVALAAQLKQTVSGQVINMYGPTETTIWSTTYPVSEDESTVPIGRPIANTEIYILDHNLLPVPAGVVGELFVGGEGLARGYLNRPELTAERFIKHPFGNGSGARLYRTGDLARYRPDGNIEYLGRMDNQVKIRGFRIELGEIETRLEEHPLVRRAVVVAREDVPGDKQLVAYIIPGGEQTPSISALRQDLKEKLPEYMVPETFMMLEKFPLTPNGKVDRRSLPSPTGLRPELDSAFVAPRTEIERTITAIWQSVLHLKKVGVNDNFFDLGGHSLHMAQVYSRLRDKLQRDLSMLEMFKYPTINSLAQYLSQGAGQQFSCEKNKDRVEKLKEGQNRLKQRFRQENNLVRRRGASRMNKYSPFEPRNGSEIAIIGMSGRFPGAKNVDEYWRNLCNGVESISFFTDQELESSGIDPVLLRDPNYVKARGVVQDAELFDASFFGFYPREAEIMDPQHRLFLECAWEALESAGYDPERYRGLIGVFGGVGMNNYFLNNLYPNRALMESVGPFQTMIGNDKDFVTTRVSYKMNLRGPSVVVQTACSTSLVAVCQACQSLLSGECDIALAGASSINVPQIGGYLYQKGGISSPDGRCRAFDAKAQGTVFSNGVGIVVLKRVEEALADRDCIHAVIKGAAVNNDGSFKVGYTAPSVEGQAKAIRTAQIMAEVQSDTITYIEAHGTATASGDPIELAALTQAFRAGTQKKGFCAIGSVKTNIGHTDAAAGVAGLIKTVLMLKNKMIPPSLHFERPNPEIDFASSPFYVNTKLSEWKADMFPRRAGVSSFGIGGTNAHVIVEEAPVMNASGKSRPWKLLLLSAKTSTALDTATTNLVEHLKQHPPVDLADVSYTLQKERKVFDHRRMTVCRDLPDAVAVLETRNTDRVLTSFQELANRDIVFMFSGQGSQYVNMGAELYKTESMFRETIDQCSEILQPHILLDLRDILYPVERNLEQSAQMLKQTFITQPALFSIEYALAKLWMSWGLHPATMIGHSIGEYVAACLSGAFSLEDAVSLVAIRGRLMQQQPDGSMLAVQLSEKDIERFLNQRLSLAAVNAPSYCVVSGETEAVKQLECDLKKNNIHFTPLHTSHAFHSKMMEPILDAFKEQVGRVRVSPPQIPFVSNLTGTWITPEEVMSPSYWAMHLRHTVRFSNCLEVLLKGAAGIFLEVGPGQTLSTFARQHSDGLKGRVVLSSLRHPKEEKSDVEVILNTLGRLWLAGIQVDWAGFYKNEERHRIPLPTYPFERQRYWPEKAKSEQSVTIAPMRQEKRLEMKEWFYVPSWKRSPRPNLDPSEALSNQSLSWLIFLDEYGFGDRCAWKLKQGGHRVATVKPGESFHNGFGGTYTINPKERADYHRLLKELQVIGCVPDAITYLWCLTGDEESSSDRRTFELTCDLGFNSLLFLAQAIGDHLPTAIISMKVVLNNLHDVTGDENLSPEKAILLGPCRVIPKEYPNVSCSCIDIELPKSKAHREEIYNLLVRELVTKTSDPLVAYRGKHRWVQTFEPLVLKKTAIQNSKVKQSGVYFITGGLGGIGLVLAEYLAQTAQAKLVLVSRNGLPERDEWERWVVLHGEKNSNSRKIRKIQSMEKMGSQVLILSADVADLNQMKSVLAQAMERFGQIHGVIHAAGVAGGGVIQLKTPEVAESIMAPKVKGTLVLDSLLNSANLDFLVLCSSIDSMLGEIGQVDYCAANAFLDAYAQKHCSKSNVITVNWCTWQEVGMAVDTEVPSDLKGKRERSLKFGLSPDDGKEAFGQILNSSFPQILVSTRDILTVIEEGKRTQGVHSVEKTEGASLGESLHPRPSLASEYVAPGNPTEQTIADIWQDLLQIEKVGIHDNFFELGGHSLLALQILSRLRSRFPNQFSAESLFERPTVRLLSAMVLEERKGEPSFQESSNRGQKRKERKLQRMMQAQGKD